MCVAGLEISDLFVGVCLGIQGLSSVCGRISQMRSLFSFCLSISVFVSDLFVCVCQGCEMSSICGYMYQFVRSLPCLWVDDTECVPHFFFGCMAKVGRCLTYLELHGMECEVFELLMRIHLRMGCF